MAAPPSYSVDLFAAAARNAGRRLKKDKVTTTTARVWSTIAHDHFHGLDSTLLLIWHYPEALLTGAAGWCSCHHKATAHTGDGGVVGYLLATTAVHRDKCLTCGKHTGLGIATRTLADLVSYLPDPSSPEEGDTPPITPSLIPRRNLFHWHLTQGLPHIRDAREEWATTLASRSVDQLLRWDGLDQMFNAFRLLPTPGSLPLYFGFSGPEWDEGFEVTGGETMLVARDVEVQFVSPGAHPLQLYTIDPIKSSPSSSPKFESAGHRVTIGSRWTILVITSLQEGISLAVRPRCDRIGQTPTVVGRLAWRVAKGGLGGFPLLPLPRLDGAWCWKKGGETLLVSVRRPVGGRCDPIPFDGDGARSPMDLVETLYAVSSPMWNKVEEDPIAGFRSDLSFSRDIAPTLHNPLNLKWGAAPSGDGTTLHAYIIRDQKIWPGRWFPRPEGYLVVCSWQHIFRVTNIDAATETADIRTTPLRRDIAERIMTATMVSGDPIRDIEIILGAPGSTDSLVLTPPSDNHAEEDASLA